MNFLMLKKLKWIKLNRNFASELNNNNNLSINFIYESVSSVFNCSIEKLDKFSGLNNDLWFIDMFKFSFRERFLENIYSSNKVKIVNSTLYRNGEVDVIKNGEIEIVKSEPIKSQSKSPLWISFIKMRIKIT